MSKRRFEVTRVPESSNTNVSPPELIPLIHIENEIPQPPPLPASILTTNDKPTNNRFNSSLFNSILKRRVLDTRRRATIAAAIASLGNQIKRSTSAEAIHHSDITSSIAIPSSQTASSLSKETEETDMYSTIQSNAYDSNPSSITNKFLQELRSKRRELREKSKNISIDLRIDFNRRLHQRPILRAQDIFDVHFQSHDDENDDYFLSEQNFFTEESQEKIRNDIYRELNRQQVKQYRKHNRYLIVGRSLLVIMIAILAIMSFTLIYVVTDTFERAKYPDATFPEQDFIPMIFDKTTNFY
ncbi:hypothetical protein I4U23_023966 [Adineta vaga]|nr:hypothetical protein I4U23_023966 [Adineta vaga]